MPRNSLPSLRAQIAKLEQQAEAMKRQVVSRLQREIQSHGLTAEDLFGAHSKGEGSSVGNGRKTKSGRPTGKGAFSAKREAKYGDGSGNVWGGMGKRPDWLKQRLDAGASLEEFLLAGKPVAAKKPARKSVAKADKSSKADTPAKPAAKRAAKSAKPTADGKKPAAKKVAAKKVAAKKVAAKKVAGNKAAAKKAAKPRASRKAAAPTEGAAEQA